MKLLYILKELIHKIISAIKEMLHHICSTKAVKMGN